MRPEAIIRNCIEKLDGDDFSVLCIKYREHAPYFFSCFLRLLRRKKHLEVRSLELGSLVFSNFELELSTSFLGQKKIFWGGDTSSLVEEKRNKIFSFLENYRGPHSIIFFAASEVLCTDSLKSGSIQNIDGRIDSKGYRELFKIFYDIESRNKLSEKIFANHKSLSLDEACLLMDYDFVVPGENVDALF